MKKINPFFLLLCVLFMLGCSNTVKPPERHSSIPSEAIWYGGQDGGAWIIVDKGDTINTFKIKVYNESTGSIWTDGLFKVSENCSDTLLNVEGVRQLINFYDGEIIGLINIRKGKTCALVPIKK